MGINISKIYSIDSEENKKPITHYDEISGVSVVYNKRHLFYVYLRHFNSKKRRVATSSDPHEAFQAYHKIQLLNGDRKYLVMVNSFQEDQILYEKGTRNRNDPTIVRGKRIYTTVEHHNNRLIRFPTMTNFPYGLLKETKSNLKLAIISNREVKRLSFSHLIRILLQYFNEISKEERNEIIKKYNKRLIDKYYSESEEVNLDPNNLDEDLL